MPKTHIIFDLDGTLIDSSASILGSFAQAFKTLNVTPLRPLTPELIGPPLMQTLSVLSGSNDSQLLQALAQAFKQDYDSQGYKQTIVFAGISDFLQSLNTAGKQLYIATNKRLKPTQLIMQHLGWSAYFKGIYALDYFQPSAANKQEMIAGVLQIHELPLPQTLYVGDRFEDGTSAEGNALDFAMVTWGYLDTNSGTPPKHWAMYDSPQALLQAIV
jgi:phosphoglycolate phosphatase